MDLRSVVAKFRICVEQETGRESNRKVNAAKGNKYQLTHHQAQIHTLAVALGAFSAQAFFYTIIGSCLRIFFSSSFIPTRLIICSRSAKHANPFCFFVRSVCVHRKKTTTNAIQMRVIPTQPHTADWAARARASEKNRFCFLFAPFIISANNCKSEGKKYDGIFYSPFRLHIHTQPHRATSSHIERGAREREFVRAIVR